jgi:hypothetical protein
VTRSFFDRPDRSSLDRTTVPRRGLIAFEQYDDLVKRAYFAGLIVRPDPRDNGDGRFRSFLVSSRSEPGLAHATREDVCDCTGCTYTGRCMHRAIVIHQLGQERRWVPYHRSGAAVDWDLVWRVWTAEPEKRPDGTNVLDGSSTGVDKAPTMG